MDIKADIPDAEIINISALAAGSPSGNRDLDTPHGVFSQAIVRFSMAADSIHKTGVMKNFRPVLEYDLMQMAIPLFTRTQETMFTSIDGRGLLILAMNPDFLVSGRPEERVDRCMFGLVHELNHVAYPILRMSESGNVELLASWMADPVFKNEALEYWINWTTMRHLGFSQLPTIDGKSFAMDGEKAYSAYAKWKRSEGGTPPSKEQFLLSPEVTFNYLKEMPKTPKQRVKNFCQHGEGDPHAAPGEGAGGTLGDGIDLDEAKGLVEGAIESMMGRALRGNEAASDALIEIGESLGGEGSKFWTRYGIGELLGKTTPSVQIRFWEEFYERAARSRIDDDPRMTFPRKMLGVEPFYEAAGGRLPLMPVGRGFQPLVNVFIDVSGSMPTELVERVFKLTGNLVGAEVKWAAFNTAIHPFNPGDPTMLGGGTDFQPIIDYINEAEEDPDCVIIVTDGYANQVSPPWPEKVVWVLTEGGNRWMEDYGMEVIETDIPAV